MAEESDSKATEETAQAPSEPEAQEEVVEEGDALGQAEEQIAALKDQVLRGQAEMENLRRRNQRDVENAHKYGSEKLIGDLLPVLDGYEKGIEAASALEGEAGQAVAEGIELAQKLFLDTLQRHGLTQLDPHGEPFDPQQHEAMAMVPNPDMEPNSVMEVLQKGYVLHERVVRAAKVVVTKALDS